MPTPNPLAPEAPPAGFGVRSLAFVMDFLILAVPVAVFVSFYSLAKGIPLEFLKLAPGESPAEVTASLGLRFLLVVLAFYILTSWLYFASLESSGYQATPGKLVCGLYVADEYHGRISFGRASARYFSGRPLLHIPLVGWLAFLIDCLFALFTRRRQALHDKLSACLVLRRTTPESR
jgi:uncharacterized RDD family membrane protein YckC